MRSFPSLEGRLLQAKRCFRLASPSVATRVAEAEAEAISGSERLTIASASEGITILSYKRLTKLALHGGANILALVVRKNRSNYDQKS